MLGYITFLVPMLFISQLFFSSAGMKSTCIGREVNALRKHGGEVREMAKSLVKDWKLLVPDANPSMTHSPQSEAPSSHSTQGHTQQQQRHQSLSCIKVKGGHSRHGDSNGEGELVHAHNQGRSEHAHHGMHPHGDLHEVSRARKSRGNRSANISSSGGACSAPDLSNCSKQTLGAASDRDGAHIRVREDMRSRSSGEKEGRSGKKEGRGHTTGGGGAAAPLSSVSVGASASSFWEGGGEGGEGEGEGEGWPGVLPGRDQQERPHPHAQSLDLAAARKRRGVCVITALSMPVHFAMHFAHD